MEDRRDDPAIDRLLQMLEEVCGELARGAVMSLRGKAPARVPDGARTDINPLRAGIFR